MLDPLPSFQTSLIPQNSTIVVGLSGGPDSIYLIHHVASLQQTMNLTIIAAHLDHGWQASSVVAIKICQDTCKTLGIPLVVKTIAELNYDAPWNGSQEELGRNMRRHFFESTAEQYQAQAIVLAHHAQDQQETFFIRLIRGSSLSGLVGIRPSDGLYIRPMLQCSKVDIVDCLDTHGIAYYTDPTNAHDTYLRNRIRNHVIPALQATDTRFEKKLHSSMEQLAQVEDFLEQHTLQLLDRIGTEQGIKLDAFVSLHTIIQQRIILHMLIQHQVKFCPSQKLFKEIMRFITKSAAQQHTIYNYWVIEKGKTHFCIKKIEKI